MVSVFDKPRQILNDKIQDHFCTREFVYVNMPKKFIQIPLVKLLNGQSNKIDQCQSFVFQTNVQKADFAINNDKIILLLLINHKLFFIKEESISTDELEDISKTFKIVDFCVDRSKKTQIIALITDEKEKVSICSFPLKSGKPEYRSRIEVDVGQKLSTNKIKFISDYQHSLINSNGSLWHFNFSRSFSMIAVLETPNEMGFIKSNIEYKDLFYAVSKNKVMFVNGNGKVEVIDPFSDKAFIKCDIFYPFIAAAASKEIRIISLIGDISLEFKLEKDITKTDKIVFMDNDYSFFFTVSGILHYSKFHTPLPHIKILENLVPLDKKGMETKWINAINFCSAFEISKDVSLRSKLSELCQKYGESLLNVGEYAEAFVNFEKSQQKAEAILINYFSSLTPNEILSNRNSSKYNDELYIQDEKCLSELIIYLKEQLNMEKSEPESCKIMNSVLLKCFARSNDSQDKVIPFIQQKWPIYEKSTAEFLLTVNNGEKYFGEFCQSYALDDIAVSYFMKNEKVEGLVKFVQESVRFSELAFKVFNFVYENDVTLAPQLFFSNLLSSDKSSEIIIFLDNTINDEMPKFYVEIEFLKFCINDKNISSPNLIEKLFDLLITSLEPTAKLRTNYKKYVSIESEVAQINQLRKELSNLLDKFGLSITNDKIRKIPPCFLEEHLVYLRKCGNIDECLNLVAQNNVDFSIALDFCETVRQKNNNKDSYTDLFLKLCNNSPKPDDHRLLTLINTKAPYLDAAVVMKNLPKDVKICNIINFVKYMTVDVQNELRKTKLENGLTKEIVIQRQRELEYLKAGSVRVTPSTTCSLCGKTILLSNFHVLEDNSIAHAFCVNSEQIDLFD